jgi:DNA polymerase III delta prime subunit
LISWSSLMKEEMLWVEKYRPHKIEDCILPIVLKNIFSKYVSEKSVPNLLLSGRAGVGKTTVAKALLDELGYDYIVINSSKDGNIDTLRTEITQFASSVSMFGNRKYVILDEADYLNANSTQPALRNFIEEFSSNCGFIMTCNFPNRILEALRSRMVTIDFVVKTGEKATLMGQFAMRMMKILDAEGIAYDKDVLFQVIVNHFPDFRKTINELQGYAVSGKIDTGVLSTTKKDLAILVGHLKAKKLTDIRKWVGEHADEDALIIMRQLFDECDVHLQPASIALLILTINKYQYQHAFAADQEINLVALLIELSLEMEWKV